MEQEKIQEKIKEFEDEIRSLPYHKGTEHHIGKLKAKIAKLRSEGLKSSSKKSGGKGFAIRKHGDATVILVGMPSVGKSTLINNLTDAKSKVGSYDFTTLDVIPGVMDYKGAKIQIFDVPGLIEGASMGKGGGKEILSVVRIADLLVLIATAKNPESFETMEKELTLAGVRLNQIKPDVVIEKKLKGGIEIFGNSGLDDQVIKSLAKEFRILNANIRFKQKVTQDQLIDSFISSRAYAPMIKVVSQIDLLSKKELNDLKKEYPDYLFVSSKKQIGIKQLKQTIFDELKLIRIYLRKDLQAKADIDQPLICKKGVSVYEAAYQISEQLAQEIKGAKIKGSSVRYLNQRVGLKHVLKDEDQVFFVK